MKYFNMSMILQEMMPNVHQPKPWQEIPQQPQKLIQPQKRKLTERSCQVSSLTPQVGIKGLITIIYVMYFIFRMRSNNCAVTINGLLTIGLGSSFSPISDFVSQLLTWYIWSLWLSVPKKLIPSQISKKKGLKCQRQIHLGRFVLLPYIWFYHKWTQIL